MLHRQKALLSLLQHAGGTASEQQLMQWAFLLQQETPSSGGKTFYRFLPHGAGPYSFTLAREAEKLTQKGCLTKADSHTYQLTPVGQASCANLPGPIAQDAASILERYRPLSGPELLDKAAQEHPWFTLNHPDATNRRPTAAPAIYTAGYEGKTVDEFLNGLLHSGVHQLVDVRANPISRRYGFHKSTLQRLCTAIGIRYVHIPELGIRGEQRAHLSSPASYAALFETYRQDLRDHTADLDAAASLITHQPSALVCMEANPEQCHRNVLAHYLTGTLEMPITHL